MTGIEDQVEVLTLAIGLVFALVCYLASNLSPGGMITPGWLALALIAKPVLVVVIGVVVVVTYVATRGLQRVLILYGKRLFATVLLTAVFAEMTVFLLVLPDLTVDLQTTAVGFIVPGLVAYQLVRQPVGPTLAAMASVTAVAYVTVLVGIKLRFIEVTGSLAAESVAAPALNPSGLGLVAVVGGTVLGLAGLAALLWRVPQRSTGTADELF
jgi:gamma-polyglutamate biosynthesis protein CapC